MKEVTIEIEEGVDALTRLREEWRKLFAASGAPPFLSWEWLTTWHKWFGQEKRPYLLCARAEGSLVGLAPLCAEKKRPSLFSLPLKRLSFLGESHGAPDYLDILALPSFKRKSAELFMDYLAQSPSFDLLELEGISADSSTLQLLTRRFGRNAGFSYRLVPQFICPRMSLDANWEELLQRSHRSDYFKRCLRRLNKISSFEFRVVSDVNSIPTAYWRFMELHTGRWLSRGGSSAARTPQQKGFMFDAACELTRAGMARFEEIWLEGECCASLFGFESGDCYYFYLSGFDQAWSKYSLGFTLLWLSIREASRRGLKMYDFLRGDEDYKFDWSDNLRMTVTAQVISNSRAARQHIAEIHAKEAARALMPDWLKDRLRRARKQPAPSPYNLAPIAPESLKSLEGKYKELLFVK
jgi:CelD/BcsL family acetyltransferase involved in cellulose biosynthesis